MQYIDKLSAQLQTLNREVKALPAALNALQAPADAGVIVPPDHRFADIYALDAALDLAFSFDGAPMSKPTLERRVRLKNQIVNAGMVDAPEKAIDEKAVLHACNLLKQHKIPLHPDREMFTVGDIDVAAAERNLSVSDRLHLKRSLEVAGLLDTRNTIVVKPVAPKPDPSIVRSIFASELELDMPASGKISMAALNRAMTARDVAPHRRMQIKELLAAAQVLAE
jgi:hypothetical protein